jgi:mRNA interferase RelE/StbE
LKIYSLRFHEDALKEWHRLDASVQAAFKKQLKKVLENPHVASKRLRGELVNHYKIKLNALGYRLVYRVNDTEVVVTVISVGKRKEMLVYKKATKRK